VTECAAICAYLAEAFPEAGLAPRDDERAAYFRWMFFGAGPLEAAVTNKALGVEVPEGRRGMVGYGTFDATVAALSGRLLEAPYLAGDRFTAADVSTGSQVIWGLQSGPLSPAPGFADYVARLKNRPARARIAG